MKIEVLHYIPCVVLGVAVLVANLANTPNPLSNIILMTSSHTRNAMRLSVSTIQIYV
jgi:hypothetical protein